MKGPGSRLFLAGCCLLSGGFALAALTGGSLRLRLHEFTGGGWEVIPPGGGLRSPGVIGRQGATMSGGSFTVISGIGAAQRPAAAGLGSAHAFPVPFKPREGHSFITFTALPARSTIRVFTLSGELVKELVKEDSFSDTLVWSPVANYRGQSLASGVYLFTVESSDGSRKAGKLMVIK